MPPKLASALRGIIRSPSQLTGHRIALWTCSRCQNLSLLHTPQPPNPLPLRIPKFQNHRPFTTNPPLLKKSGGKQESKRAAAPNAAKTAGVTDPFDFSVFEADIKRTLDSLKHDLSKIRAGGLDAERIEDVRVKVGGSKGAVVKVGEVAQVVQRGRVMVVMVGEAEHINPITTALISALSITPSTPPSAPLELHIPIPPTTAESRALAQKEVAVRGEAALFALREARGAQKKKLRAMELAKEVGPDERFRAEKKMDGVNEGGVGECKRVVEERRKGLGR